MITATSTARRRSKLGAALVVAVGCLAGCDVLGEQGPSKKQLDELVDRRASQSDVVAVLGEGYTSYAPDTDAWTGLLAFLERERSTGYAPVRQAVRERKAIMYYTTAWQQTWLIFGSSGRVERYWRNTQ